jgi:hypothetical protein
LKPDSAAQLTQRAKPQPKDGEKKIHHRGAGREKKSKNHKNCKSCLNKIKYLQLPIFAKTDFFS